jgi:hypothetical protein
MRGFFDLLHEKTKFVVVRKLGNSVAKDASEEILEVKLVTRKLSALIKERS